MQRIGYELLLNLRQFGNSSNEREVVHYLILTYCFFIWSNDDFVVLFLMEVLKVAG